MDTARLLRRARLAAGLTQKELAKLAGTSQPTVASYEAGRLAPRLDTLERVLGAAGFDVEVTAHPRVRRGAVQIRQVADELRRVVPDEGVGPAWRLLLDFVDDFAFSSDAGKRWLVADEPGTTGDLRFDAALGALVELLCDEAGVPWPGWTDGPGREAKPWWFVAALPGYEAVALRDSPIEFKRHGVFVTKDAFTRA